MDATKLQKEYFTIEKYLELERKSFEKHIYLDGEIIAMAGETEAHGIISVNLTGEFRQQLKGKPCMAFAKDMKVRSGAGVDLSKSLKGFFSYPDIVIACGERQYHDKYRDILLNPNVIVEVLSDSTEAFDRGEKFRRFRENLPSLTDYVLVSQKEVVVEHYRRGENGEWILATLTDVSNFLNLPNIECRISLAEIYDRVEFPPEIEEVEEEVE